MEKSWWNQLCTLKKKYIPLLFFSLSLSFPSIDLSIYCRLVCASLALFWHFQGPPRAVPWPSAGTSLTALVHGVESRRSRRTCRAGTPVAPSSGVADVTPEEAPKGKGRRPGKKPEEKKPLLLVTSESWGGGPPYPTWLRAPSCLPKSRLVLRRFDWREEAKSGPGVSWRSARDAKQLVPYGRQMWFVFLSLICFRKMWK